MAYKPTGGKKYTLSASISSTATSITLSSFKEPVSDTEYTMSNIGSDIVYATIAPKTDNSEFISFTGITQNADGTATLTGVTRGLSRSTPFTTSATFKLPHSAQTQLILSNSPQHYEEYVNVRNTQTISGTKTFSAFPITPSSAPTTDYQVANKKYADDTIVGLVGTASTTNAGTVEEATDAELAAGTAAGSVARLFANGGSFTQTPTANKVPVGLASGLLADGWLGLTTAGDLVYSDGSVLTRLALGTSGYFLTAGASTPTWTQYANLAEANTVFGSTDISGAELEDLSDGGATNLHTHAFASGQTSRLGSASTGTQNIAHGLGRTPTLVKITAFWGNSAGASGMSVGSGTATNNETASGSAFAGAISYQSNSNIIYIIQGANVIADLSALDATNITLNFTTIDGSSGSVVYIQWEAF